MRVISYSLFGYGKERHKESFDFNSYLRGLMVNMRLSKLLFPDWNVFLYVDPETYVGLNEFFSKIKGLTVIPCDEAPLTKAMLWRLKPAYDARVERFICRDLDSPLTYRDAQAVKQWTLSPKAAHAITDSVSHTIPMMGGMIGFVKQHFHARTGTGTWEQLVDKMRGYERKGADQDLLGTHVYPKFANGGGSSVMQHYFLGMSNTFLDGYLTCGCYSVQGHKDDCPLNIQLPIADDLKGSNATCGHIGAGGFYEGEMLRFLRPYKGEFNDLREAEQTLSPVIFNWDI
jgi:hypothetical protein